jgi:hypothetical protein
VDADSEGGGEKSCERASDVSSLIYRRMLQNQQYAKQGHDDIGAASENLYSEYDDDDNQEMFGFDDQGSYLEGAGTFFDDDLFQKGDSLLWESLAAGVSQGSVSSARQSRHVGGRLVGGSYPNLLDHDLSGRHSEHDNHDLANSQMLQNLVSALRHYGIVPPAHLLQQKNMKRATPAELSPSSVPNHSSLGRTVIMSNGIQSGREALDVKLTGSRANDDRISSNPALNSSPFSRGNSLDAQASSSPAVTAGSTGGSTLAAQISSPSPLSALGPMQRAYHRSITASASLSLFK